MKKLYLSLLTIGLTVVLFVTYGSGIASAKSLPNDVLSDRQLSEVNGGITFYCGGPTCPSAAECVKVGTIWRFYYNNHYLDCYFGWGSCGHKPDPVTGLDLLSDCYARDYGAAGCSSPLGPSYVISSQPYCGP